MKEEATKVKVTARARVKKFRADQDPEKDEPFEVFEGVEHDVTDEFFKKKGGQDASSK